MRRGYWTGFIVGGILGMVAARSYGDRLLDSLFPGMISEGGEENTEAEGYSSASYRPRRRRRFRREY